jgi:hypothetical protein
MATRGPITGRQSVLDASSESPTLRGTKNHDYLGAEVATRDEFSLINRQAGGLHRPQ